MRERRFVLQYTISFIDRVKHDGELVAVFKTMPKVTILSATDEQDAYKFFLAMHKRLYGVLLGPEDVSVCPEVVER